MSEYGDDLRRIVGIDKVKDELTKLSEKVQIISERSIAYQTASGGIGSLKGNAGSGGIQAPGGGGGTTGDIGGGLVGGINSNPSPNDPNNPGNSSIDSPTDLENILDDNADQTTSYIPGLPSFQPIVSSINGWSSLGVQGQFNFHGYVPPARWSSENPDTAPSDAQWQQGYSWSVTNPASATADTPSDTMDAAISRIQALFPASYPTGYGDAYWDGTLTASGVNYTTNWYQGPGAPPNNTTILRNVCVATDLAICPITAPQPFFWPLSGKFQIAPDSTTGAFVASGRDSEAPLIYRPPGTSKLVMDFGSGRQAIIENGLSGTKLLYETDPATNLPLANTTLHIYDNSGVLLSTAPIANITQYQFHF